MANSRYDVEIRGDNKGLTTAVDKSMKKLNELDSVANGLFSNFTGPLNNISTGITGLSGMSVGMAALGAAGIAASAGLAVLNSALEKTRELNEISTNTGLSVEYLQQLQKEFKSTGMEIDKFGDLNRDALDKIGDSLREGSGGIADDLEKWGISLERYTQYANDAEGGVKALIQTFYDMRAAGASQAEIVNGMESMASDGSNLISVLSRYSSTQEALNAIQGQTASITNETAAEYKEFDSNMKELSSNLDNLSVNVMGPLVDKMNKLFNIADKEWTTSGFFEFVSEINSMSPDKILADWASDKTTEFLFDYFPNSPGTIKNRNKEYLDTQDRFLKNSKEQGDKAFIQMQKDDITRAKLKKQRDEKAAEDSKKLADKEAREKEQAANKARQEAERIQRERESAEREAKAAYERMMQDRRQSLEQLSQLDIAVISSEQRALASQMNQLQQTINKIDELQQKGIITSEQATERRNSLLKNSAKEFKDAIAMNPADIGAISQSLDIIYQQQLEQLEAKKAQALIGQEEYNRQLESIQTDYKSRQAAMQGIDGNLTNYQNLSTIGFSTDEQSMALQQAQLDEQFNKFREDNQALYDGELISYDDFLKQKEALDRAYAAKSQNISMMEAQTKMGIYNNMASGMAGVIAGISGENSKASQAAFAVAKGTAIAQGMLNAYQSATTAMATYPGPLGYALAASSYASVLGQVMSMKSIQPSGMAHDGITEIPREGTWLLDGGERVVDERTNGDLKDFLNKENQGSQPIDARVIVNGNVTDQRWFAEQLKKQEKNLTAIVQSGNRRKM